MYISRCNTLFYGYVIIIIMEDINSITNYSSSINLADHYHLLNSQYFQPKIRGSTLSSNNSPFLKSFSSNTPG
jgi:hypothetical protein